MIITRYFVLAGLLVGSAAHAAPSHRESAVHAKVPFHADAERMLASAEEEAAPEDIADSRQRTTRSSWELAIARSAWAPSVQADVWFGLPFDFGVAGASESTWPTTLDPGLRVSSTTSLTAGWGSMTTHRVSVITQLRGPRVALQFGF